MHQGWSLAKGRWGRNAASGLVLLLVLFALAGAAVAAGGSAVDPKAVVLRVGPIAVTLEEFSRDFHYQAGTDTTTLTRDAAGVERFLDRQVATLLLHAWAMRDTTVLHKPDRFMFEMGVAKVLQDALRDELLPRYLRADETVLRAVYDRMATDLRLATIKVPTLVELDSVQAALARGEPFAEVARRWSKDRASAIRGGEIGWVDAKRFGVAAQEILWSLPVGTDSAPVAERQFHSIYRVLEKRPAPPRRPFEEERSSILTAIYRQDLGRAGTEMHEDLLAAYNYRVDMEAAEWLRAFLEKETAAARRTYDPKKDKPFSRFDEEREKPFWSEAPLKGEEAARPIAFSDAGQLTALEVIDELVFRPTLVWPSFESIADVLELCNSALYYRIQLLEARRLGLDRRPEIARQITNRKRWMLWRAFRRERILPEVTPSEEELRALYEERVGGYGRPERRKFVLVHVPTRELADQVAELMREGLVPSTIVRRIGKPGLDFTITPDTTLGWVTYGQNPAIDQAIFGLQEGEVSDPLPVGGGYSVLRIERASPAHILTFAEVEKSLRKEIVAKRERSLIAKIVEKARPVFDVWIDREAIGRMEIAPESSGRGRPGTGG